MTDTKLIELAAFAAMAGGALRIVSAFAGELEAEMPRELFYLIIDVLFLFGTLGIYLVQRHRLGWPGLLGFVFAASGFTLIAGPDGTVFGLDAYAFGSNVIGAGLFVLSLAMFKTKSLSAWAPGLWIASIVLGAMTFHVSRSRCRVVLVANRDLVRSRFRGGRCRRLEVEREREVIRNKLLTSS